MKLHSYKKARADMADVVNNTPCQYNEMLSKRYQADIYLKREDLQNIRSFKIRGAYNSMNALDTKSRKAGVVCASAGNHAQGVAHCCKILNIHGTIFMPKNATRQKISLVKFRGDKNIEIELYGDSFDECRERAIIYAKKHKKKFIESFNNNKVIQGQGTIALELIEKVPDIQLLYVPVGGGGLLAGIIDCFDALKHPIEIVGVEPYGASSLQMALEKGKPTALKKMDTFTDGAAVKKIGKINFELIKDRIFKCLPIDEGKICTSILEMYNLQAIVVEPAGALAIAALELDKEYIKGKKVVCIISGGNNDFLRMQEIMERSLMSEGLKKYFLIAIPQRAGALKEYIIEVLGTNDDITRFEYIKRNNRSEVSILLGIEFKTIKDYERLIDSMEKKNIIYEEITNQPLFFDLLHIEPSIKKY